MQFVMEEKIVVPKKIDVERMKVTVIRMKIATTD